MTSGDPRAARADVAVGDRIRIRVTVNDPYACQFHLMVGEIENLFSISEPRVPMATVRFDAPVLFQGALILRRSFPLNDLHQE